MGTTVIGGMLAASFLAIFLIPVTFYVVEEFFALKGTLIGSRSPLPNWLALLLPAASLLAQSLERGITEHLRSSS
jgi:hypothetical protein